MEIVNELLKNKALIIPLIVVLTTQILKIVYYSIKEKKFKLSNILLDGGMPSSHSAFITSMATVIAIEHGFTSPLFAIAVVFSNIVMHDASGVRYAAGQHAAILNKILEKEKIENKEILLKTLESEDEKQLVEYLGHTKLEVFAGLITGILLTVFIYYNVLR